jgi:hypothetical protein
MLPVRAVEDGFGGRGGGRAHDRATLAAGWAVAGVVARAETMKTTGLMGDEEGAPASKPVRCHQSPLKP